MSEDGFQEVPAQVGDLPAGAALAAVLESIDPRRVSAYDAMRVLAARRRQLAHEQAMFSAALLQAVLADPAAPGQRADTAGRFDGDELRMVLHESAAAIHTMVRRAEFADARPIVRDAWDDGRLERERVRILDTWTEDLSEEHRAAVLGIVVPEAVELTQKELIDRVEQLARDLDPEWARKRYESHRRQRRIRARRTDAGTANLSGLDLGLDDGALAYRHIAVMAARAKALGHPGLTDTVEADIYVALLKPRPTDFTDDDVIAAVVAAANPADPHDPRSAPDPEQAPPGPIADPDHTDPTTADHPNDADADSDPTRTDSSRPSKSGAPARAVRWPRRAKLGLRVGLGTLLGLDRHTARMPGYGIVHAEQARQLTRDWADAEWRLALQDDTGALSTVLVTRKRPDGWATVPINPDGTPLAPGAYHPATGQPAGSPSPPRELVVIHATEHQLAELSLADHPDWAELITDARRQALFWHRRPAHTTRPVDDLGVRLDGHEDLAGLLADLVDLVDLVDHPTDRRDGDPTDAPATAPTTAPATAPAEDPTGDTRADPHARFPSAAQRRWISERNQTCVFPGCGADAVHCETDHTRPHRDGGPTLTWNLGPACTHDNALKEQPGWWVEQPEPGHFVWHSNTGHSYPASTTGPVPDHPAGRRFARRSSTAPHEYAGIQGAWANEPYPVGPRPTSRRPLDDMIDRPRGHPPSPATRAAGPPSGPGPDDDEPPPF